MVACGVMAHADGVLDGEECDLLLAMVEGEADADEYGAWLSTISDRARLEEMLTMLPTPPEAAHREILETAWTVAVADGERTAPEEEALARIAARLGIESVQLEFWREAWTEGQHTTAELLTDAACVVLGGNAPLDAANRAIVRSFTRTVPTTADHREVLLAGTAIPKQLADVGRRLRAVPKRKRKWAIKALASLPSQAPRREDAQRRLVELGAEAGLSAAVVDSLLEG